MRSGKESLIVDILVQGGPTESYSGNENIVHNLFDRSFSIFV